MAGGGTHKNCMTPYFFLPALRPYALERLAESIETFFAIPDVCKCLHYLFLLSVLDLLVPCPFVLHSLALGRNALRQNQHQQHRRNERLFLPIQKTDGLIGSAHPADFPVLAGQSNLTGSESCSFALRPGEVAPFPISRMFSQAK